MMMKKVFLYLLIAVPLFCNCQPKYNSPPYNEYEEKIRKLPQETEKIIIPKEWQKMDSLSFLRLKEIQHIIIDADSVPNWITNFHKVVTIYSHFGKIKSMPISINKLKQVEKIAFFSHSINEIPNSICDLKKLEYLSLSSNDIEIIPNCVFQMKNVKTLDLISNKIQYLPSIITLEKIEKINLDGNQITELPESIYNLKSLKEISLGGNPLKNPEEIKRRFTEKGIKAILE